MWEKILLCQHLREKTTQDTEQECHALFKSENTYRVIRQYTLNRYKNWPLCYSTTVWPKLHIAARLGLDHTCRILLEQEHATDCAVDIYGTALHIATVKGHQKVIHVLLECGANVDAIDLESGETPLVWSVTDDPYRRPNPTVAHILLDAKPRLQLELAFVRAAGLGDIKLMQRLLGLVGHPDAPFKKEEIDDSALRQAVLVADEKMMRFLIAHGADIDLELWPYRIESNVMSEALWCKFECCEILLREGGSILYSLPLLEKWQGMLVYYYKEGEPLCKKWPNDPSIFEKLLKWLRKYNLIEYTILRYWFDDRILRALEVEDSEAPSPVLSLEEVKKIVDHEEGETAEMTCARFRSMISKRCELVKGLEGNDIDKSIIIEINESENIAVVSFKKPNLDEPEDTKIDELVDIEIDEANSVFGLSDEGT